MSWKALPGPPNFRLGDEGLGIAFGGSWAWGFVGFVGFLGFLGFMGFMGFMGFIGFMAFFGFPGFMVMIRLLHAFW